jgi:hypothetical protein
MHIHPAHIRQGKSGHTHNLAAAALDHQASQMIPWMKWGLQTMVCIHKHTGQLWYLVGRCQCLSNNPYMWLLWR